MMDEALIDEVAQHGVIFNRQKYYLNGSSSGSVKYETKDEAWQIIAMKLRTDIETCKKRWKYLRERYVSQRKQGDPPVYEHLSRPYLEKMKFLDQHIQPRKSYRNVPSFLTSPHSANSSNYSEYNMDSKSNGSMKGSLGHYGNSAAHHYHQDQPHSMNALSSAAAAASAMEGGGLVKIEADQVFRDFAAAVASQQLQHISHTQMHHQNSSMDENGQSYQEHYRDNTANVTNMVTNTVNPNNENNGNPPMTVGNVPSSSSSMKSPLSSPLPGVNGTNNSAVHCTNTHQPTNPNTNNQMHPHVYNNEHNNDDMDTATGSNLNMKKPRVQLNTHTNNNHNNNNNMTSSQFTDETDDDSDDNSASLLQPQTILNEHQDNNFNTGASTSNAVTQRSSSTTNSQQPQQNMFSSNTDFLYQLYQQLPLQQQSSTQPNSSKFPTPQNQLTQRSSEHLLGELVTTELLKMTKERRKHVQKRILEILFFDD